MEVVDKEQEEKELYLLAPRREHGVARHAEGQLYDDYLRKRLPGHVHALPERVGGEQHACGVVLEGGKQAEAVVVALLQDRDAA